MKKLFTVILLILITMTALSNEIEQEQKDRINNIIVTFQVQKITYNGQEGFFIPVQGYNNMVAILRDYLYYQDLNNLKETRIRELEKYEITNIRWKTTAGISISFNIGLSFLAAGLCVLCYDLAKK